MSRRTYSNSKEDILNAAVRVLSKKGLRGLTTDAVIRESGLSKAGFFYNFKTKNELVKALFSKLAVQWTEDVKRFESEDGNPVGRTLRANLRASFEHYNNKDPNRFALYLALTEMLLTQPNLIAEQLKELSLTPSKNEKALPMEQQILVCLAMDGLFAQMISPPFEMTDRQRKRVFQILVRMTEVPIEFPCKGSSK